MLRFGRFASLEPAIFGLHQVHTKFTLVYTKFVLGLKTNNGVAWENTVVGKSENPVQTLNKPKCLEQT
jgi:hypothetical protein